MINRRLIRIKALQILYASNSKLSQSSVSVEKELFFSINKYFDLYHLLLSLIVEIAKLESDYLLQQQKRRITKNTHQDFKFHLSEFQSIKLLGSNLSLNGYLEKRKLSWIKNKDFLKQVFADLRKSYFYQTEKKSNGFTTEIEFLINFYSEFLSDYEKFIDFLEEESIYWVDDFNDVLVMVIKTIKNVKLYNDEHNKLLPLFKNEDDREFAINLVRKAIVNKSDYLKIIEEHTRNWDTERIAQIDLLLLRLAVAELLNFPSIPVKVTMNEYIEISKYYSTEKSKTFINGLLDHIIKSLKTEGQIVKTGRGLFDGN